MIGLIVHWVIYVVGFVPSIVLWATLFWCDPRTKRGARLWPLAIAGSVIWITGRFGIIVTLNSRLICESRIIFATPPVGHGTLENKCLDSTL